jgi:hypothetical protein
MRVQGYFKSPIAHGFNPASEPPSSNGFHHESPSVSSVSFSYYRLDFPTRPPASARDGNEIQRPPSSTCTRCREWEAVIFKGEELSYGLSPSLQECLSTSVLSEFLFRWICSPFYLTVSSPTKLAALPPDPPTSHFSPFSQSPSYILIISSQFWSLYEHCSSGAYKTPQC